MAAPILWAPGKIAFVLQETRHAHKIPRFRGGGGGGIRLIMRGVPWQGGAGLDTYQICIQARFDTYQIAFLI